MSFPDYVTARWPDPGQPARGLGVRLEAVSRRARGYLGSATPGSRRVGYRPGDRGEDPWSQRCPKCTGEHLRFPDAFLLFNIGRAAIPPSPLGDGPLAAFLWRVPVEIRG